MLNNSSNLKFCWRQMAHVEATKQDTKRPKNASFHFQAGAFVS